VCSCCSQCLSHFSLSLSVSTQDSIFQSSLEELVARVKTRNSVKLMSPLGGFTGINGGANVANSIGIDTSSTGSSSTSTSDSAAAAAAAATTTTTTTTIIPRKPPAYSAGLARSVGLVSGFLNFTGLAGVGLATAAGARRLAPLQQQQLQTGSFLSNIFSFINSALWAAYGSQKENLLLEVKTLETPPFCLCRATKWTQWHLSAL